jgi:hypothetical protein
MVTGALTLVVFMLKLLVRAALYLAPYRTGIVQ